MFLDPRAVGAGCAGRAGCVRSPSRRPRSCGMALLGFAPLPSSPALVRGARPAKRSTHAHLRRGVGSRYRPPRGGSPVNEPPRRSALGAARRARFFPACGALATARAPAAVPPSPALRAPRSARSPSRLLVTHSGSNKVTRSGCHNVTFVPLHGPAMVSRLRRSAVGTISRGGAAAPRRCCGGSPRVY